MKKLNIVFLGTPPFVKPIKDTLAKYFTLTDSLNEADLGIVASFGRILTKNELTTPKFGLINIHPSLLPRYRGPSPIQSAILNGDQVSGITIIKIDEEMDHGSILYQEEIELSDRDNFDTLSKKMFLRSAEVLPKVIEDFVSGKIKPAPQNHELATFCKTLTRKDGYFDINSPPSKEQLDKMIRAYFPWPGVWTKWHNKIVKFLPSASHPELDKSCLTTTGSIKYLIQMEGKKVISLQDFLNGYPDFPIR